MHRFVSLNERETIRFDNWANSTDQNWRKTVIESEQINKYATVRSTCDLTHLVARAWDVLFRWNFLCENVCYNKAGASKSMSVLSKTKQKTKSVKMPTEFWISSYRPLCLAFSSTSLFSSFDRCFYGEHKSVLCCVISFGIRLIYCKTFGFSFGKDVLVLVL